MKLLRRGFLTGIAALASSRGVLASDMRIDGAVVVTCTSKGISGIISEGEGGALLDPSFRWHIGSNTKAMTAALYARMVDRGVCRWGTSVGDLFPAMPCHAAWNTIRVEHLLSHASGLTDSVVDGPWLDRWRVDRRPVREQRRAVVEHILSSPPAEQPGTYRYGNLNYVLIGAAVEEAAKAPWEEVLRAEIFAPARMTEAGFGAPPRMGPWGRELVDGALQHVDPVGVADNPAVLWPSGGVNVSASAYAEFLSVFLRDGAPLLEPNTLSRLLTPVAPELRYAGGWSLDGPTGSPARVLSHNGSNTLWFASALIDRQRGRGYAAVTNCGGEKGAALTARLLEHVSRP
ncbi:beta-lactamase family protein [Sphingomonas sp. RRHST34]|uniref:Beta-lactamase family protein n=1 Tax=Sphingomonas citri TaxID=2862499 RepID=A0ABS7BLS6_9SPHN|nr:serine hydrolase domain-containing protein [Sphingomonas citri]MBW6530450.1 beta-lactamase family protein [Sphingomonas citri]